MFASHSNAGFMSALPPAIMVVNIICSGPQASGSLLLNREAGALQHQAPSPTAKLAPGKVLGETESSHEPARKEESQTASTPARATATKPPNRRRTLDISYLRPRQDFCGIQATLDPDTPVNWVSRKVVQRFPSDHFTAVRRVAHTFSDGRILESDESIVITWRCSSGKAFDSDFRVFRTFGRRPPDLIIGRETLEEHAMEFEGSSDRGVRGARARRSTNRAPAIATSATAGTRHDRKPKPGQDQRRQTEAKDGRLLSSFRYRRQDRSGL